MISPTTMLANDIVGWYTRTSTSAVTSLCPELILHTKSKWIKNGTNVWQIKPNQIKCCFLETGQNWSTRRKTYRIREGNQHNQPTYDAESENRARATLVKGERFHHYAHPAPLATLKWKMLCSFICSCTKGEMIYPLITKFITPCYKIALNCSPKAILQV